MQDCSPLWVVEGGGPVEHSDEEDREQDEGDGLETQPPAKPPDGEVQRRGHESDPTPCPTHYDHLHQLTALLEVLAQHQHEAVLCHGYPGGHNQTVANVDLVELSGEGGEQTAQ